MQHTIYKQNMKENVQRQASTSLSATQENILKPIFQVNHSFSILLMTQSEI